MASLDSQLCSLPWQHHVPLSDLTKTPFFVKQLRSEGLSVFQALDVAGYGLLYEVKLDDANLVAEFARQNAGLELTSTANDIFNHICVMLNSSKSDAGCRVSLTERSQTSLVYSLNDDENFVGWKMTMQHCRSSKSVLLPLLAAVSSLSEQRSELLRMIHDRDDELAEYRSQFGGLNHYCKRRCDRLDEDAFLKSKRCYPDSADTAVVKGILGLSQLIDAVPLVPETPVTLVPPDAVTKSPSKAADCPSVEPAPVVVDLNTTVPNPATNNDSNKATEQLPNNGSSNQQAIPVEIEAPRKIRKKKAL